MFELYSKVFGNNEEIPDLYTCKGKNISPPLMWKNIPKDTKSFALIMEDLDTPIGVITHWVLYNIPGDKREISEDISHMEKLPDNTFQGMTSMRKIGYMGPCPPWGKHRYIFKLYALDIILEIIPKMSKRKLLKVIKGHVIDQSQLMGIYSKR
jgi:Raf kinase inhibitor-like YbhB/YbcL family protein